MADAYGKLTGRPGHLHGHARPRRDARGRRHPHRLPGLDAADPPDRPGRPRDDGPGGVPGDRLPPHVRADGEVGRADRRPRAGSPSSSRAPSTSPPPGGPGPVVLALPGGHARRGVRRRRREARRGHPRPSRSRGRRAGRERCSPARSGRSSSSAARRGASRRTTRSPPGAPRARSRSPPAGAGRTTSTTARDAYVGHLALGADPRLAQRVRDADVLLVIGDRLSEITTAGYTLLGVPDPAQALIHVTADPEELGRVYTPALGGRRVARHVRLRPRGAAAARAGRARGGDAPGARRTISTTSAASRCRASSTWAR